MRAPRPSRLAALCALAALALAAFAGCSRDKAAALKAMAAELAEATRLIEDRLVDYWARFLPPEGPLSEESLYGDFAAYLSANRGRILKRAPGFGPDDLGGKLRELARAIEEARELREDIPWRPAVRQVQSRAAAIRAAVGDLEAGSYLAGRAVARLERHLLGMARDLMEIRDHIVAADAIAGGENDGAGVPFDPAVTRILAALESGAPSRAALAGLLREEIDRGFDAMAQRRASREDLEARLVLTAGLALEMADAAKSYRRVRWPELVGYLDDLGALASELELPERLRLRLDENLEAIEKAQGRIDAVLGPGDPGAETGDPGAGAYEPGADDAAAPAPPD